MKVIKTFFALSAGFLCFANVATAQIFFILDKQETGLLIL